MKSKKILSVLIAAILTLSVFAVVPASVSAKTAVEYRTGKKVYKSGGAALVKLTVRSPKLTDGSAGAKKINAYFVKLKNKYKKEAQKLLSSAKSDYKDNPSGFNPYTVTVKSKLMYNKNGKYSFKVIISIYTGGAHPNSVTKGVSFDKATGAKLKVSQLTRYNPTELKSRIVKATYKKIDKNPKLFFADAKTTVKNTKLNSFSAVLKGDYLYIIYQTYEIAPYASGVIKVKISNR